MNVALVIWLVVTANLVLDVLSAPLSSWTLQQASLGASGVILMLLASYVLISVLTRPTAMILIACSMAIYVVNADNREIAGALLRAARLGGGIPQAYYPPNAKADASPQLVCLILAIGESRIVWIPDAKSAKIRAPCASAEFRARFKAKPRQDTQDLFKAASGVQTLKRENFKGAPATTTSVAS